MRGRRGDEGRGEREEGGGREGRREKGEEGGRREGREEREGEGGNRSEREIEAIG